MIDNVNFELKALFQEAFKLWYERSPNSRPIKGNPVFEFFRKFKLLVQNLPFRLGFENYIAGASVGKGTG